MGKLVGMLVILAGALRGLESWRRSRLERQKRLEELAFFFGRAEYALEVEQRTLICFFEEGRWGEPLQSCLQSLARRLSESEEPDGYRAWRKVMEEHRREWNLTGEEWESLLAGGGAFFGRNRKELRRLLAYYRQQMERYYEQERVQFRERQKVVFPVGLLGSAMLIVLLL